MSVSFGKMYFHSKKYSPQTQKLHVLDYSQSSEVKVEGRGGRRYAFIIFHLNRNNKIESSYDIPKYLSILLTE